MHARRVRREVDATLDRVRESIACLTAHPVNLTVAPAVDDRVGISFVPSGRAIPLRTAVGGRLGFQFRQDYAVREEVDGVGLIPAAYAYRLLEPGGREILAYHWHPEGVSHVTYPHMHLSSRIRPIPIEPVGLTIALSDHHIPTGHVSLGDVIRYLIAEIGVEPRRSDWRQVLGA